jgi:hypothetical protein
MVTVDFARALELAPTADQLALKQWYGGVASRLSATA